MLMAKQDTPGKPGNWASGLIFGTAFGFLLHKAGVSDYNVLIGALRLTDLTVIRVIISAILVGSIIIYVLGKFGMVRPHIKPTHYANNIIGGLVFGVGFGLWGYCPGTGAAALGQGSWDAAWGIFGMVIGSYVYALTAPKFIKMASIGERGKLTVPELIHIDPGVYIIITSIIFVLFLMYIP
ncbi:MAG: YeeE/YedE family protein [Candidatus Omnitrophica bacterium]|nr:YeeE/YedE family protein [Candidatus Omnitrophota bacterium]